ncbi:NfeD family protein [Miltoncostaea marina]|uniref:NfeD family protein n=1 Tax=Miltoncostaea marina TaxID=2843215 RepID=UPI001C3E2C97|nr:NfeD family protein [Miltoncostaea marina]
MRPALALLAALVALLAAAHGAVAQDTPAPVRVIELDGGIDPVSARWVEDRLDAARDDGAAAVVIRMDTPGGLVSSMRDIVAAMERSPLPVAVWVGPAGSRAGSAGAFISAAAAHLGMAPGTNIGSATPIGSGGEDLDAKVRNDAAASIAALAEARGRDPAPFRAMVVDALNLTAREALEREVAETVQPDLGSFVAWLDGRPGPDGPIRTAGAPVEAESMPWHLRLLEALIDPNLVFLLLLLGLAGIGFELYNPGAIVPGVVGAISLLLALAGLTVLPVDWVGIALIALGVGLFVAETQVGGFGALAAGGVVALGLGGAFLFDSDDPALVSSPWIVGLMAAVVGAGFLGAARLVLRARRRPAATGGAELVGEMGVARGAIGPDGGRVSVNGEIWSARTADGSRLPAGAPVRVVSIQPDDLTVTVEPGEG